jgi:hypothetical protein
MRGIDNLISRIDRRLLALAKGVWHNLQIGAPAHNLTAYDHNSSPAKIIQLKHALRRPRRAREAPRSSWR